MAISKDELIAQLQEALDTVESSDDNETVELTIGDSVLAFEVEETIEDEDEDEDEDEELVPNKYGELFDSNGDFVGFHHDWIGGPDDHH